MILRHPETQTTPASGSRIFVCTAQGDVLWYIDDRWLSSSYQSTLEGKGFTFQEVDLSGYQYTTTNLTITVPAREDLNGTEIYCETAGSDGILVSSTHSWLRIVGTVVTTFHCLVQLCNDCSPGPPLPPNVTLELASWNTMRLSWSAPFTAAGFPINKYIIIITNSSTDQTTRTDVYPTDGNETFTLVDTPGDCHTLKFRVQAESSAGTSSDFEVSGGFPAGRSASVKCISLAYHGVQLWMLSMWMYL